MRQPFSLRCFAVQSGGHVPSSFRVCTRVTLSSIRHLHRPIIAAYTIIAVIMPGATASAKSQAVRPPAHVAGVAHVATFVAEASRRFGIPAAWIRAVMRAESAGDAQAVSPKGAIGLMQIMPDTWAALRQRYHLGTDPYNAHDNIIAGAAYLRELHDRYGIPGFLAAYNAGPARWEDHLATGRPLPAETRAYLVKLAPTVGASAIDDANVLAALVRSWTEASLFPKQSSRTLDNSTKINQPHQPSKSTVSPPQDWTGLAPLSDGLFAVTSSTGRSR